MINSVVSLNYWVVLTEEATNEPIFWQGVPCFKFDGSKWPPTEGVSLRMALDANDIGWDGHTMQGVAEHAHEYLSKEESGDSSTCMELLGVFGCLQAIIDLCEGKSVLFYIDAQNLLGM